jgi:uridylate kinase
LRVVVKIGGHLFPSRLDASRISDYVALFKKLKKDGHSLIVITGGGIEARKYIDAARELGGSELICDIIGIMFSRINARLLIVGLGEDAYPELPVSFEEIRKAFETGKIVVLGGLQPGQSTNAVGILSAEAIDADIFVNATDVDGVYSADPDIHQDATKMDIVKADDLLKMVLNANLLAGSYKLFDPLAIKIVKRSGIQAWIIDGRDPKNIERVINGEKLGTLVRP